MIQGRRGKIILGSSLLASLIAGLILLAHFGPSLFAIRELVVSGGSTVHLSQQEIVKLSGVRVGENLFSLNLKQVEKNLRRFSWVKEATLIKQYPHRLFIKLNEYQPVAIIQLDDWYYIDAWGEIFKKVEARDSRNFPVITGIDEKDPSRLAHYRESLKLLYAFRTVDAATQFGVSEIHWEEAEGYMIYTLAPSFQIKFGQDNLAKRLLRWKEIGTVLTSQFSHVKKMLHVDMTYETKVYVKFPKSGIGQNLFPTTTERGA